MIGEHRIGGVGVAPAQRRAGAQGATRSDHADQQEHHKHGDASRPARRRSMPARTRGALDTAEQPGQQQRGQGPGQQQAQHRETVPDHAGDGAQVLLHVLEHQTVQALMEFAVEIQLDHGKKQTQAGDDGQPGYMQTPRAHRSHTQQRQTQRNAQVDDQTQVEARAIDEGLGEGADRCIGDQRLVVGQQAQPSQGEKQQHAQRAAEDESQVTTNTDLRRLAGSWYG